MSTPPPPPPVRATPPPPPNPDAECLALTADWLTWHEPTMLDALDRPIHCPSQRCTATFRPIDGIRFESRSAHVRCPTCNGSGSVLLDGLTWNQRPHTCGYCGREADTAPFMQRRQIGLIVVRLYAEDGRRACAPCARRHFLSMTGTTLVAGWWGLISFFVTPYVLISNTAAYLSRDRSAGQPHGPWIDWRVPPNIRESLAPHEDWALERLSAPDRTETSTAIGKQLGERAGVSWIYAMLYLQEKITHRMRDLLEIEAPADA
ncbi:MAG: hypothetical protein DHS20C14_17530 [Phycisphaeraceae bacterium]|nr:MAG: hypothetical protein DHS20C14_17530 [Phycisphaeraceae bacterium]